jgi:hypothetical protein
MELAALSLLLHWHLDTDLQGCVADPAGIMIELLPRRLRDHMPDRYIGSLTLTNPSIH